MKNAPFCLKLKVKSGELVTAQADRSWKANLNWKL